MSRRVRAFVAAGAVAAAAMSLIGATVVRDNDVAITGDALAKASAAALAHTGGGRVTETEVGDEDSYYEVEVTLDDGTQVDVQLDRDFRVVGDKVDDDTGERGGSGDD